MNTRFAVAVHILTLLQAQAGEPASSEWIAGSVNTNPALIRRLLSQLAKAGLTRSQRGAGGGALLARSADSITLADVYQAVSDDADVIPIHAAPNPKCPVGRHIESALAVHLQAAEQALQVELARTTIASLTQDIFRRATR
ncbi:Rrf2 family transcriptional regulator [Haliangium ochraceum]|uniref:Transcriptional regulator, BadM/Rrf2 family n=1 Tax=Haliangium ochraceum (strain DSM 14365 / JCM 11303 / SMP-2) TaxID=502025 RepID=D0LR35_HALO1|nr:Rrf2 family transcriptional regulator [Haliangium ochraceum]ACY15543.1 transcriptional regulator, BadM/Rrf2 family [Haliangium ochraceum DSM 14365]